MAPRLDDENPAPTVETDETPNVMPPHTVHWEHISLIYLKYISKSLICILLG